jgi:hypothetical protein
MNSRLLRAVTLLTVMLLSFAALVHAGSGRADTTCGTAATRPQGGYQHVVWILEENTSYSKVIGPDGSKKATTIAPYINSLANHQCGLATSYHSIVHPSLPDYLALTSGGTQGVTTDTLPTKPPAPFDVPSIFDRTSTASLQESMPQPCYRANAYPYKAAHNPQLYYLDQQTGCSTNNVPLDRSVPPDLSASFTLVTPNLCHDMHGWSGCPVGNKITAADSWLRDFMQQVFLTPQWLAGDTAVFITWDEGTQKLAPPEDSHVATIVVAPSVVPGTADGTAWTHYSLLNTTETLLGQPCLANACGAGDMSPAFNLR